MITSFYNKSNIALAAIKLRFVFVLLFIVNLNVNAQRQRIFELQQQVRDMSDQITKLQTNVSDLNKTVYDLNYKWSNLNPDILASLQRRLINLEEDIKGFSNKLDQINKTGIQNREAFDDLKKTIQNRYFIDTSINRQFRQLKDSLGMLHKQINDVQRVNNQPVLGDGKPGAINNDDNDQGKLKDSLETLKSENFRLIDQNKELENRLRTNTKLFLIVTILGLSILGYFLYMYFLLPNQKVKKQSVTKCLLLDHNGSTVIARALLRPATETTDAVTEIRKFDFIALKNIIDPFEKNQVFEIRVKTSIGKKVFLFSKGEPRDLELFRHKQINEETIQKLINHFRDEEYSTVPPAEPS